MRAVLDHDQTPFVEQHAVASGHVGAGDLVDAVDRGAARLRESRRRTNLWWMAGLTPLVVYEKTGAGRRRAVSVAGLALLASSALALAHPHWLPAIAGGSA